MSQAALSRRLRASLACSAALPLSALLLGACADRGASPEAGQAAANAEAAGDVSGAGTLDFLLGDPDQPVTRRVAVPGAESLRVLVSRLDGIVNELVQAGRGDTDDNTFRVTGDTVTVSVGALRNVDFRFNTTEDKALR